MDSSVLSFWSCSTSRALLEASCTLKATKCRRNCKSQLKTYWSREHFCHAELKVWTAASCAQTFNHPLNSVSANGSGRFSEKSSIIFDFFLAKVSAHAFCWCVVLTPVCLCRFVLSPTPGVSGFRFRCFVTVAVIAVVVSSQVISSSSPLVSTSTWPQTSGGSTELKSSLSTASISLSAPSCGGKMHISGSRISHGSSSSSLYYVSYRSSQKYSKQVRKSRN